MKSFLVSIKSYMLFIWIFAVLSIWTTIRELAFSLEVILVPSLLGIISSLVVVGIEIYRNSLKPERSTKNSFAVSDLSNNILLLMVFISIVQSDLNKYIFMLGTGVYALIQGIVLVVLQYVFKKNLVRSMMDEEN